MRVLVVAPHPDDEVLGVGGTSARFADEGHSVTVVVVTKGEPELFDPQLIERGRQEARLAHSYLGVKDTVFLDFPAARLDQVPHHTLNRAILEVLQEKRPDIVFVPFLGDVHLDHRLVFDSTMVAVRPTGDIQVKEVYAYETLSETNWNASQGIYPAFEPDFYIRVNHYLERKLEAMRTYSSQLRQFPHERSLEAIEVLAKRRGTAVGVNAAEAFITIRRLI